MQTATGGNAAVMSRGTAQRRLLQQGRASLRAVTTAAAASSPGQPTLGQMARGHGGKGAAGWKGETTAGRGGRAHVLS